MTTRRISYLACLWATQLCACEDGSMLVRIQDYADVSAERLSEAVDVTQTILADAGVKLEWEDCSPNRGQALPQACSIPAGALSVLVRLVPNRMSPPGLTPSSLGYSLLPPIGFGSLVSVFVDKARRAAEDAPASRSSVLGHAIAHEIAHLLLGDVRHNWRGLMQASWSREALMRATAKPMHLTKQEANRIRQNLRKRIDFARAKDAD